MRSKNLILKCSGIVIQPLAADAVKASIRMTAPWDFSKESLTYKIILVASALRTSVKVVLASPIMLFVLNSAAPVSVISAQSARSWRPVLAVTIICVQFASFKINAIVMFALTPLFAIPVTRTISAVIVRKAGVMIATITITHVAFSARKFAVMIALGRRE